MFTRDIRRLVLVVGSIFLLLYSLAYFDYSLLHRKSYAASPANTAPPGLFQGVSEQSPVANPGPGLSDNAIHGQESTSTSINSHGSEESIPLWADPNDGAGNKQDMILSGDANDHYQVFSTSTHNGKFLDIDFGSNRAINPNILPHPILDGVWIVVAQKSEDGIHEFHELACDASLSGDGATMRCQNPPTALPISKTEGGDHCDGELSYFNFNVGPHDARVFHGPEMMYIVFGSNSIMTCFGQFVQDFAGLVGWNSDAAVEPPRDFSQATELQRPGAWSKIEKNWFLFWDGSGAMYVHHDIWPKRVFATVLPDGSVGPDLAPFAAASDEQCMLKYFPQIAPQLESVHQATNSLRIIMCNSTDQECIDKNPAFIFIIYQHKTYYSFHSVYEPYIMVFEERAPFEIHAMSKRPIWIHGREMRPEANTSDMFYVTSMSWNDKQRRYSGFLDDVIFIAFGIEDERAGAINVLANDLLADLGSCEKH
jgi:hypothetical protein